MKTFWEERYSEEAFVYGTEPNEFLKERLDHLEPGSILFVAAGEGRNAVYAASQGWDVTAFDQSEQAKKKCLRLCAERDVKLDYHICDATEFDYGEDRFDVIALIYAHFPIAIRSTIHRKCIEALKTGGGIVLEGFNPKQIHNRSGGPKDRDMLYTTDMLAKDFKPLEIQLLETRTIHLDEGAYHRGQADIIRLLAIK